MGLCTFALQDIDDPVVLQKVHEAMAVLRRTLALYPLDKVAFSFNGGKDSTVLLHLLRAVMEEQRQRNPEAGSFHSFYFVRDDDFEEVDNFVREMDVRYDLHVAYLTNPDFKKGLEHFITSTGVSAIILGTRRGDPNARDQEFFCPSSEGWPPFMRVNPILDWTYSDVWTFLKSCKLPYCKLYDQGYTSLGYKRATLPNRALLQEDGTYAPAHMLPDGRLERAGRVASTSSPAPIPPGEAGKEGEGAMANGGDGATAGAAAASSGSFSHTAAIVVVGDELLSGKVEDTNIPFLCAELHSIGWQVTRVVMVPDDMDSIASEVRLLSQSYEVVITTGGVGPTLDDVTMLGVARALNKKLVRHPGLEKRLRAFFGDDAGPAHLKMADLPEGEAELLDYPLPGGELSKWPVVRCRNVYVLPGVPRLLQQKWHAIKGFLTGASHVKPFRNQTFRLGIDDETRIASALEEVAKVYGVDVHVGSYPVSRQEDGAQILVTLDGKLLETIQGAAAQMRQLLPQGSIIREDVDVRALLRKNSEALGSGALSPSGRSAGEDGATAAAAGAGRPAT